MNDFFQENKRILFILTGLLIVFALVLAVLIVRPLLSDLKAERQVVVTERDEIELLEVKIAKLKEDAENVDMEEMLYEKTVPATRQLDDYILSLQQLENQSNSAIRRIDFTYDSQIGPIEVEADPESDENEDAETAEPVTIDPPEGLEVMNVQMTAEVPSFDDLVALVEGIEEQERISVVRRMDVRLPDEDEASWSIVVNVMTFYHSR